MYLCCSGAVSMLVFDLGNLTVRSEKSTVDEEVTVFIPIFVISVSNQHPDYCYITLRIVLKL